MVILLRYVPEWKALTRYYYDPDSSSNSQMAENIDIVPETTGEVITNAEEESNVSTLNDRDVVLSYCDLRCRKERIELSARKLLRPPCTQSSHGKLS
jgi:hypothetical protein